MDSVKLNDFLIKSYRVTRIFQENADQINSLNFSSNGETLITSGDDDSIVLYDCLNGSVRKNLNSKKYGVDLIRFTNASDTVIHSSTKIDDTIRFLSLQDNKYIRYFPGHVQKVVTLSMSPVEEIFLSGSLDNTIRLWDLKSTNCTGLIHLNGRPIADFDPDGLIFAAGLASETIRLYDLRSFDKGPFNTFNLRKERDLEWTGIRFSPDGRYLVLTTNGNVIYLIDAFTGQIRGTFTGFVNAKNVPIDCSFTADGQYLFSGSTDGHVHSWNVDTGKRICSLINDSTSGNVHVAANPKFNLLVAASNQLTFWLPVHEEN